MEELDVEGLFWLPTKPDDRVAGRLKFDGTEGTELHLIGSLYEDAGFNSVGPVRIHGVAGKKILTLDGCLQIQKTFESPGILREGYYVPIVLSGAYFEDNEPLEFAAVYLELSHLGHWIWKSGIETDLVPNDDGTGYKQINITYTPLDAMVVPTAFGELELSFPYSFRPDPVVATTIKQSYAFRLRFAEPWSLQDALQVCSTLQNLVTIGVHAPASIMKVSLGHADLMITTSGGKKIYEWIDVYAQFHGNDTRSEKRPILPMRMLFTFDDIEGLKGVAEWLGVSNRYQPVVGVLLSHWYIPRMYVDNRFFNAVTAAEALERIRRNKQSFDFDDALRVLADKAGDAFEDLVGDVECWVKKVVRTRVNNVVHRGLHESEDPDLYLLSESLYFLVVMCLLRECGVSDGTFDKMQQHRRFKWLADRFRSKE